MVWAHMSQQEPEIHEVCGVAVVMECIGAAAKPWGPQDPRALQGPWTHKFCGVQGAVYGVHGCKRSMAVQSPRRRPSGPRIPRTTVSKNVGHKAHRLHKIHGAEGRCAPLSLERGRKMGAKSEVGVALRLAGIGLTEFGGSWKSVPTAKFDMAEPAGAEWA